VQWQHINTKPAAKLTAIHKWVFDGKPWEDWKEWLALNTFSMLAEAFNWDSYTSLIKQYYTLPNITNNNDKLDMWARRYSQTVNTNLCPYFEWWGWPLTAETKDACSKLPKWNQNPLARYEGVYILVTLNIFTRNIRYCD